MFCKSFHSCNRIYRKHFPSLLTEGEQKDLGCGAGEDEEKQPRELHGAWQTPLQGGKWDTKERMFLEDTRYLMGTNVDARQMLIP